MNSKVKALGCWFKRLIEAVDKGQALYTAFFIP